MYAYFLPNGIRLDIERLVDAALEEGTYPQTYLDTESGAIVELPSVDSLELWTRHGGNAARYTFVAPMPKEVRDAAMRAFIEEVLKKEATTLAPAVSRALARGGWRAAEEHLAGRADGWFDAWSDFLEDEAWGYLHEWLIEHPDLGIETVFEGCGNCAVCELVLAGEGDDTKKLRDAFVTEDVMRSVAEQMETYAQRRCENDGEVSGDAGKRA